VGAFPRGEVHEESSGVSRGTEVNKVDLGSWFTSEFLIQRALPKWGEKFFCFRISTKYLSISSSWQEMPMGYGV